MRKVYKVQKFTKHPGSYVKAATDRSTECIGYGVNYRSMYTAIHGIIWSPDKSLIDHVALICQELEHATVDDAYTMYMEELESYFASNEIFWIEEIDYRDITKDNKYYTDDNEYIQIINPGFYDLYM